MSNDHVAMLIYFAGMSPPDGAREAPPALRRRGWQIEYRLADGRCFVRARRRGLSPNRVAVYLAAASANPHNGMIVAWMSDGVEWSTSGPVSSLGVDLSFQRWVSDLDELVRRISLGRRFDDEIPAGEAQALFDALSDGKSVDEVFGYGE